MSEQQVPQQGDPAGDSGAGAGAGAVDRARPASSRRVSGRRGGFGRAAAVIGVLAVALQIGSGLLRSVILRLSFDDAVPGGSYDAVRGVLFALQGVWCLLGFLAIGFGIAAVATNRSRVAGIVGIVAGAVAVIALLV